MERQGEEEGKMRVKIGLPAGGSGQQEGRQGERQPVRVAPPRRGPAPGCTASDLLQELLVVLIVFAFALQLLGLRWVGGGGEGHEGMRAKAAASCAPLAGSAAGAALLPANCVRLG